ncbi:hypothetical protein HAX54_048123 [Datura stramonium]|uniref:Bifunctional inhibitor/plant lipid transfer protein/seed storage helical domain-containing protein n=1 Tax=Datura stramonium TaxID=4076 RepID=A0ABS8STQ6_DATST|nr:hypothetical protein [Datura stramonium]
MPISRNLVKPLSLLFLIYIVIAAPFRAEAAITWIKFLYGVAKTRADRRSVCSCLKIAASSVNGINFKKAAALPGKCGVKNIHFMISPKVNCSKALSRKTSVCIACPSRWSGFATRGPVRLSSCPTQGCYIGMPCAT